MSLRKEMKRMEAKQAAQDQLNELSKAINQIDKMLSEFQHDAREHLLANDEDSFELVANSIFYFQDVRKILQTVKVQFQTYTKTAEVMDTIEGIRPVLKKTADMMNSMPSFQRNNKDFIKFKKALMRGQLNMKAMGNMISHLNPAVDNARNKQDFADLRASLLAGQANSNLNVNTDTATSSVKDNLDFFDEINK